MNRPTLLACLALVAGLVPATAPAQQQPDHTIRVHSTGPEAGRRGAALGAVIGAVPVALWRMTAHHKCSLNVLCLVDQPELILQTLIGAAVGAGVGYVIGTRRGEQRQRATLDVGVTPSRVQLSVRF